MMSEQQAVSELNTRTCTQGPGEVFASRVFARPKSSSSICRSRGCHTDAPEVLFFPMMTLPTSLMRSFAIWETVLMIFAVFASAACIHHLFTLVGLSIHI